jgi:IclR family KDG regulon transcriptional repressor
MKSKNQEEHNQDTLLSGVTRAFSILEVLADQEHMNLETLAKKTRLPKPTALRFLNTLIGLGFVYRNPEDQYSVTLKLFSLGAKALDHLDLYQLIRPFAKELSESLGETVHVGVRDEDEALYILKIESKYTIRMYSRVGKRIPLYCTAIGKALLTGSSSQEITDYSNQVKLVPFTPSTITKAEDLVLEVEQVRTKGIAQDNQEHETGIRCIGAPILDFSGRPVAAMSASWPLFRFNETEFDTYCQKISSTAQKISRLLGAPA